MASNVSQQSTPYYWTSANDDIIYEFSFNAKLMDSVADSSGNTAVVMLNPLDILPVVGEFVYTNAPGYTGTFKVLSVTDASNFVIDATYSTTITSSVFNLYHLRIPTFSLYKGYKTGEQYDTDLPYELVVPIKSPVLYGTTGTPYLSINVKGLTRYLFAITSNTVANSADFSMFNAIRIEWDGLSTVSQSGVNDFTLVINSALTNSDLQYEYIQNGKYLTPIDKPLIATQGVSFASIITTDIPILHKFINGIKQ